MPDCTEKECPICYEPLNNKEPYFKCSRCKIEINLDCILQSCKRYWNKNEKCKCPYCKEELTLGQEDYLIDVHEIRVKINNNKKDIEKLENIRQENISKTIANQMGMMDFPADITTIEDRPTLNQIRELENENKFLEGMLLMKTKRKRSDSDYWENPFPRRGGSYKKKTTKKTRKTTIKKRPKKTKKQNIKSKKYSRKYPRKNPRN
jgi:hypothetical protein